MSHCCGGCGGEDPSKNKVEKNEKETVAAVGEKSVDNASVETSAASAKIGTWQPAKK